MMPVISSLQAALRGFATFNSSSRHLVETFFDSINESRKTGQSQQENVIMFLLDSDFKPNELDDQNVYAIQLTAKFCSGHIVEKFILADADVNSTQNDESVLFAAIERELSAASIVRRLLAIDAIILKKVEEQEKLLKQILRYFQDNTSRKNFHDIDDPDDHFLIAPSLEYVFSEESEAVLFDLLNQMPQIKTTEIRWTLVLQMIAFLNDHSFLDLLLSRDTDVNAIGYYYGTALKAAARCGHISMVQKLLNAGAEVNVLEGRWQTALRAALVDGHADVVETLLDHDADMELRRTEEVSENALQLEVKSGNLRTVKILLKHGANAVFDESETLHSLILASTQESVAMIKELLNAGASVNIHEKKRSHYHGIQAEDASSIHAVIVEDYLNVTRLLLSQGADIENNVEGVRTPLSVAASKERADIVRLLLSVEANAIDDAALSHAVREDSIEIAQELLAAGSKAASMLVLTCRQGRLSMIELLLEKIYDDEKSKTVVDEIFAVHELDDSVFQLLLDYASSIMRRFVQVCAAGSIAFVEIMLNRDDIDINEQDETNGDHSLQIAALHLHAKMIRFLLLNEADVNCKSAKHETSLMTALKACAISTLRRLKSANVKKLVKKLSLSNSESEMAYYSYRDSAFSSFRQLSDCEKIVRLLVIHEANIIDDSRSFGPSLHLVCLLKSKILVELLLEKGVDLNATVGFFEKIIFVVIQRDHSNIVALLLQKASLINHIHPEYTTSLHLACVIDNDASMRKLLEHDANVTAVDAKGRTPLTIALEEKRQSGIDFERSQIETSLNVILKLANPLHILDNDLVTTAELNYEEAKNSLTLLLNIVKSMIVSEAFICHVFNRSLVDNQIIKLLMQRSNDIEVTIKMLKVVRNHYELKKLLEHRSMCRITSEILKSQKTFKCLKFLLDIDPETPVTEEVIFRALEIGNDSILEYRRQGNDVLETLFGRSPDTAVIQEMLQAVRCAADMEILLKHLKSDTRIFSDVIAAVSRIELEKAYLTMRPLLKFDLSIRLDPKMALQTISYCNAIDALEMLLKHDPSMLITEKMFLRAFGQSSTSRKSDREKLANLMHKYKKRLVFTDKLRKIIDHAYQNKSEAAKKKRFYSLRVTDEADIEPVGKGTNEETPETSVDGTKSSDSDDNICLEHYHIHYVMGFLPLKLNLMGNGTEPIKGCEHLTQCIGSRPSPGFLELRTNSTRLIAIARFE